MTKTKSKAKNIDHTDKLTVAQEFYIKSHRDTKTAKELAGELDIPLKVVKDCLQALNKASSKKVKFKEHTVMTKADSEAADDLVKEVVGHYANPRLKNAIHKINPDEPCR